MTRYLDKGFCIKSGQKFADYFFHNKRQANATLWMMLKADQFYFALYMYDYYSIVNDRVFHVISNQQTCNTRRTLNVDLYCKT